ncbi:MAG TPA: DUF934 domain-containing protein [Caulobacteraceae bacterium]|jgi:uncharacterized protein (DUF934 family)|nr:DUF934 domain-containing protein [Caulobacteraceae bacterium]
MPKLIKLEGGAPAWAEDAFFDVLEEDPTPGQGGVILSLERFRSEGEALLAAGRDVGVRLDAGEEVEALVPWLDRLALVALEFPKFRDGRQYSQAALLRERYRYGGEVRAVGAVLLEQGHFMVRCGFDAFVPADGSGPDDWAGVMKRYRHVYQTAADGREPNFALRLRAAERI